MKKTISIFVALFSAIGLFAQTPECSITLKGDAKADSVMISYLCFPETDLKVDYARKSGEVLIFRPLVRAESYFVFVSTAQDNINIVLNEGENLTIVLNENGDYTVSGTNAYVNYDKLRKSLPKDAIKREEELMNYFSKNESREEVPLLLLFFVDNEDNFINTYNRMPSEMKNGKYKDALDFQLSEMTKISRKKKMINVEAKNFTLLDKNGKECSLNDYRGKYVILDFWASWCGWCIRDMGGMKKYYDKYCDKIEIIGINLEDKDNIWKDAVAKYQMNWIQLKDDKGEVKQLYGVKMLPSKVIIEPNGKILKFVDGADPVFYEYLDELLKK